jgi:hypothetical protein
LIGVHPDYQNKAVTAVIFSEYYHTFKRGVENCFRTPELLTTQQFIIYGNISTLKLIAEENSDRVTSVRFRSKQHLVKSIHKMNGFFPFIIQPYSF